MAQLTLGSTVLWDNEEDGGTHNFSMGYSNWQVTEVASPSGVGFWVKPAGRAPAIHSARLMYRVDDLGEFYERVSSWQDNTQLQTLSTPIHGTLTNCRISNMSFANQFKTSPTEWMVEVEIEFTQYP